MVYYGTNVTETIVFHPAGEPENVHYFELTKLSDAPVFVVEFCCDEEWRFMFKLTGQKIYEQVKGIITDAMFEHEDIKDMLDELEEFFTMGFGNALIGESGDCDHDDDCNGDCEHCKYLN